MLLIVTLDLWNGKKGSTRTGRTDALEDKEAFQNCFDDLKNTEL